MSSHREAPEISQDPVADSTDLYAFVSTNSAESGTVTIIANYIPLEHPDGGPNFYEFGQDVLYAINIDNDGDGVPEIVYQFEFTTTVADTETFLYNTGPITNTGTSSKPVYANWNRVQTYKVTKTGADGTTTVLGNGLPCPPCNIGPLSTPDYSSLSAPAVRTLHDQTTGNKVKVFAGQRGEGFYVDLGAIFDLGDIRPFENYNGFGNLTAMPSVNSTRSFNVHSIALQVEIADLTATGQPPTGVDDPNAVIGVTTTASRQRVRIFENGQSTNTGPFVQVSRLGNPLVNEVIIPLGSKDLWNSVPASTDSQFAEYFSNPGLAQLLPVIYKALFPNLGAWNAAHPDGDRADLVAILLTGIPSGIIPGFQNLSGNGSVQADMLRLNMAIPPAAVGTVDNLGLLGGDLAGFPNGRRVYDDVTTIELKAVAGATLPLVASSFTPDGAVKVLSERLTLGQHDLTASNTEFYLSRFPYLAEPHSGYNAHTAAAATGG
jgi:hypothetical protein